MATVAALAWMALTGAPTAKPASIAPAPGQDTEYRIVHWTTAQGLPQNTINDIVLLPDGELWIATFGGLARFDGHAFRVIDVASDDGLPANRIVSLAIAGEHAFWFLTQQGHLGRVERGRPSSLVPPPGVSVDAISLVVDRTGRIYCKKVDGSVWHTDGRRAWEPVLSGPGAGATLASQTCGCRRRSTSDSGSNNCSFPTESRSTEIALFEPA